MKPDLRMSLPSQRQRDLFVLVADRDIEAGVKTLLSDRRRALKIDLEFDAHQDCLMEVNRDGGCRRNGARVLKTSLRSYRRALLLFDREGCGSEDPREKIEQEIEEAVHASCTDRDCCAVIAIDPELEAWVWSRSPEVENTLGWQAGGLRRWLEGRGLWPAGSPKPAKPKEALLCALKERRGNRRARGSLATWPAR